MIPRVDAMELLDQAQDDIRELLKFAEVVQNIICGCYMLNVPCVCPMFAVRGRATLMLYKYASLSARKENTETVSEATKPDIGNTDQ